MDPDQAKALAQLGGYLALAFALAIALFFVTKR
jgi:hypothetical protein